MGDPAAVTLDQDVSKATPEMTTTVCPRGPAGAKTLNCMGTPDILNFSFMTGWGTGASRGQQGAAPKIMINGSSTKDSCFVKV